MENYVGKTCPYCNTEIREGDNVKVCPECGTPHHAACWETNNGCIVCSGKNESDNMSGGLCPNCKTPFGEGDLFCSNCGMAIKASSYDTGTMSYEKPEPKKSKKTKPVDKKRVKKIVAVSCVFAVVLLSALVLFPTVIMPQINLSMAKSAAEDADYASAVEYYEKSGKQSDEENVVQYTFCEGMAAYNNKDYSTAIIKLTAVKDSIDSAKATLPQVYYDYGKSLFNQKQYSSAQGKFESAGEYSDAKKYVTACQVLQAEELLNDGYFSQAKTAFQKLPKGLRVNGISVSGRLNTLNNLGAFVAASGKWSASKNYISSKDVSRWDGSWENWYHDDTYPEQYLEIRCTLNSDGTVNIKGEVSFYRFTNYSILSSYCNTSMTTKTFTMSNLKSIPSSYRIDANTKLIYSGGKFSISYSMREEYSAYSYYLYETSVTYGSKTATY